MLIRVDLSLEVWLNWAVWDTVQKNSELWLENWLDRKNIYKVHKMIVCSAEMISLKWEPKKVRCERKLKTTIHSLAVEWRTARKLIVVFVVLVAASWPEACKLFRFYNVIWYFVHTRADKWQQIQSIKTVQLRSTCCSLFNIGPTAQHVECQFSYNQPQSRNCNNMQSCDLEKNVILRKM